MFTNRMAPELKLMVTSYCDFFTLLTLYNNPVWHAFALDSLPRQETSITPLSSTDLRPLADVVGEIKEIPYGDR